MELEGKIDIAKSDEDQRTVFGWAKIAVRKDGEVLIDWQEDLVDPKVLESAAYDFVLEFREANDSHEGPVIGELVESVMFTKQKMSEMGIPDGAIPEGWWVGFKVNDATFADVKKGRLRSFSIEGSATRAAA